MTSPDDPRPGGKQERPRYRPLVGLLAANVVSVLGGAMSLVALPWFVFNTTGSAALTGIAAAGETVPVVVVSVVAGGIVARVGARRARVGSDSVAGVTVLAIPLLHATVGLAYWQLLLLVAVNGALRTPAVAASMVMLRELTSLAGLAGDQTTGPYTASVRLAATLGTPTAGVLIASVGAPSALVVDAVTFLVSAGLILLLVPAAPVGRRSGATRVEPPGESHLTTGFRTLRDDTMLLTLTVFAVVLAAMAAGWNSVGAPVYGRTVLSSSVQLGVVLGVFGAGALLGNLAYAPFSRRLSRYAILIAALVCAGPLPWIGLALHPPLAVLLVTMTFAGLGLGALGPLYLSLQYTRVAPDVHAHLFGLTFGLQTAGEAVGAVLAGLAFTYLTMQQTLFGMAAITATLVPAAVLTSSLRPLRDGNASTAHKPTNALGTTEEPVAGR
jgi:predicted MFS family arabinose efflux permease